MKTLWGKVKLIAAWLFDQLVYPWIVGSVHAADMRAVNRMHDEGSK